MLPTQSDTPLTSRFQQRYYENLTWWDGAGSPIICIMGGEGAIEPSTGIFYPWVRPLRLHIPDTCRSTPSSFTALNPGQTHTNITIQPLSLLIRCPFNPDNRHFTPEPTDVCHTTLAEPACSHHSHHLLALNTLNLAHQIPLIFLVPRSSNLAAAFLFQS